MSLLRDVYISIHAYCILPTITCVQGISKFGNGTGPLKLLHLYGNLAIVVTTSNKLVAEPRQACSVLHVLYVT